MSRYLILLLGAAFAADVRARNIVGARLNDRFY